MHPVRVLPLAVGSDFCLRGYLTQQDTKGGGGSGHRSGAQGEEEGDLRGNEEPMEGLKKR